MNRPIGPLLLTGLLSILLVGCDSFEPGTSVLSSASSPTVQSLSTAPVAPTLVTFPGYTVKSLDPVTSGGQVTYSYEVTGIAPGPPSLDWFFLENACGVSASDLSPRNSVRAETIDGFDGYKWNASLPAGQTRIYSYTFPDTVEPGIVRVNVQRGGTRGAAQGLRGPCGAGVLLSGSVRVGQVGIRNVRVEVLGDQGAVSSGLTASDGGFSFRLLQGNYTVRIPQEAANAFNATLYASYDYLGGTVPASQTVSMSGHVSGVNFMFTANGQKIINDLTTGPYRTQARDVRYWQGVLRVAVRDGRCDPLSEICRTQLNGFLDRIFYQPGDGPGDYYLLEAPFAGPAGDGKFQAALDILTANARTDPERVFQNLFAMQLNMQAGWGTGNPGYEDALQGYLESWVLQNTPGVAGSSIGIMAVGGGGGGTVELQMTRAYLGGGGGGSVGG